MKRSSQLRSFELQDPSCGGDGFQGGTTGVSDPFFSAMMNGVQKKPDVR